MTLTEARRLVTATGPATPEKADAARTLLDIGALENAQLWSALAVGHCAVLFISPILAAKAFAIGYTLLYVRKMRAVAQDASVMVFLLDDGSDHEIIDDSTRRALHKLSTWIMVVGLVTATVASAAWMPAMTFRLCGLVACAAELRMNIRSASARRHAVTVMADAETQSWWPAWSAARDQKSKSARDKALPAR